MDMCSLAYISGLCTLVMGKPSSKPSLHLQYQIPCLPPFSRHFLKSNPGFIFSRKKLKDQRIASLIFQKTKKQESSLLKLLQKDYGCLWGSKSKS